jgi:Protein of unknown function (DUF3558)
VRPTSLTTTIVGGIAALVLVGCSNPQSGTPSPSTTTTTTSSSAPAIANPLDTTNLQKNLCGGLTAAQLAPYVGTVSNTNVANDAKSKSCQWFPSDTNQATIALSVYPNLTVSDMYATGANFPFSKKLDPMQGYPTQDTSQGNPPYGECSTAIAVSDHVVVEVESQAASHNYQYYNNMCVVSEALAPILINNIKASG